MRVKKDARSRKGEAQGLRNASLDASASMCHRRLRLARDATTVTVLVKLSLAAFMAYAVCCSGYQRIFQLNGTYRSFFQYLSRRRALWTVQCLQKKRVSLLCNILSFLSLYLLLTAHEEICARGSKRTF